MLLDYNYSIELTLYTVLGGKFIALSLPNVISICLTVDEVLSFLNREATELSNLIYGGLKPFDAVL